VPELRLEVFLNERVVLDTQGPMIYIGTLMGVDERGYWLGDADVHDRSDGHSSKEVYINSARELERGGTRRTNRRRVFIERHAVVSLSGLFDVVSEDESAEGDAQGAA
jgi:hypothetical protein